MWEMVNTVSDFRLPLVFRFLFGVLAGICCSPSLLPNPYCVFARGDNVIVMVQSNSRPGLRQPNRKDQWLDTGFCCGLSGMGDLLPVLKQFLPLFYLELAKRMRRVLPDCFMVPSRMVRFQSS